VEALSHDSMDAQLTRSQLTRVQCWFQGLVSQSDRSTLYCRSALHVYSAVRKRLPKLMRLVSNGDYIFLWLFSINS